MTSHDSQQNNNNKFKDLWLYVRGTPEAWVAVASILVTLGALIVPWIRNVSLDTVIIVIFLILACGYWMYQYLQLQWACKKREEELIKSQKLYEGILENFHGMLHQFRSKSFALFAPNDLHERDIRHNSFEIDGFEEICEVVSERVISSFTDYFVSRNINIQNDLSVCVKLVLTADDIIRHFGVKLSEQEKKILEDKQDFIITVYRSRKSGSNLDEKREIGEKIYTVIENTVFMRIIRHNDRCYVHNDLRSLGDSYISENKNWQKFYNSILVVPIKYTDANGNAIHFGLLSVDSMNPQRHNLYDNNECKNIMWTAGDLLATFFLNLAILRQSSINTED